MFVIGSTNMLLVKQSFLFLVLPLLIEGLYVVNVVTWIRYLTREDKTRGRGYDLDGNHCLHSINKGERVTWVKVSFEIPQAHNTRGAKSAHHLGSPWTIWLRIDIKSCLCPQAGHSLEDKRALVDVIDPILLAHKSYQRCAIIIENKFGIPNIQNIITNKNWLLPRPI